jgi:hypothetical protein
MARTKQSLKNRSKPHRKAAMGPRKRLNRKKAARARSRSRSRSRKGKAKGGKK